MVTSSPRSPSPHGEGEVATGKVKKYETGEVTKFYPVGFNGFIITGGY